MRTRRVLPSQDGVRASCRVMVLSPLCAASLPAAVVTSNTFSASSSQSAGQAPRALAIIPKCRRVWVADSELLICSQAGPPSIQWDAFELCPWARTAMRKGCWASTTWSTACERLGVMLSCFLEGSHIFLPYWHRLLDTLHCQGAAKLASLAPHRLPLCDLQAQPHPAHSHKLAHGARRWELISIPGATNPFEGTVPPCFVITGGLRASAGHRDSSPDQDSWRMPCCPC